MFRAAGLLLAAFTFSLAPARGGSGVSRGAPHRVTFEYRRLAGAERCPDRAALEAQVTDILGQRPFARRAPRTVRCTLRGAQSAIAAKVELVDARSHRVLGIRELSATGCEELGAAVALAIALAIDPLARPPQRAPVAAASGTSTGAAPVVVSSGVASGGVASGGVSSGVSAGVRTDRAPGGGSIPDAGPLRSLGLPPAAVALALAADAGQRSVDAGIRRPPLDAGSPAAVLDAGTGLASLDAGVPSLDAGAPPSVDAGVAVPEPDAGLPPVAAEASAAVAETPPSSPPTGWRPVAGVGAVAAVGVLPGIAGGVLFHAGAASSTASVEVEARWLPGTSLSYGGGSISTSLVSGALVGCARFGPWAACGLTLAGPLQAKGQGYTRSEDASAWLVSVGARGQWEWHFAGPVGLRLHIDAMVNLVRPRLLVDSQAAWTTPPVSVWVGGGLFGRF